MDARLKAKHGSKVSIRSDQPSELNTIRVVDEEEYMLETTEMASFNVNMSRYRGKAEKKEPHPYLSKGYDELLSDY